MSFFKLEQKLGYEVVSDSIHKILGYIEKDLNEAECIAEGWSVQLEHRSGLGFNVTDEIFAEAKPSSALLEQAMFLDSALIGGNEEPRFIEYTSDGKKRELPIFEIDKRSLEEQIEAARFGEAETRANIFSVIREVFVR